MQPALARHELLVSLVAHSDHDSRNVGDLVEGPRCRAGEIQPGTFGGGERTRMDPVRGMCAG